MLEGILDSNPYFSAGAGLAGLGVGMSVMRLGMQQATIIGRRYLFVTLEVTSKDRAYPWVLEMLSTEGRRPQHLSVETTLTTLSNGTTSANFGLVPMPGRHLLKYQNRWISVERSREKQMVDFQSGAPWETVTLTTLGRDLSIFTSFLEEARDRATAGEEGTTTIFTSFAQEWRPFGLPRKRRPLESVILEAGAAESIIEDVEDFLRTPTWYTDRGIPYRRGYLLYGPPGCGKSSFISAVAGALKYNICLIDLGKRSMTDDILSHAIASVPPQSLLVLEDIDSAFVRRNASDTTQSNVTFSGLLNTLDGVASSEERIIFMTTNHLDRLDPALVRPGRVDVIQRVGEATSEQIGRLFARFYPDTDVDLKNKFVAAMPDRTISMAALQGYLLIHKTNPEAAVADAPEFVRQTLEALEFIRQHEQQTTDQR